MQGNRVYIPVVRSSEGHVALSLPKGPKFFPSAWLRAPMLACKGNFGFFTPFRMTGVPFRMTGVPFRVTGVPFRNTGVPFRNTGVPFWMTVLAVQEYRGAVQNVRVAVQSDSPGRSAEQFV